MEGCLGGHTELRTFSTLMRRGPPLATIELRHSRVDFDLGDERRIQAHRDPPRLFFFGLEELHSEHTRRRAVCFVLLHANEYSSFDVARLLEERLFAYLTNPVRTALAVGAGLKILVDLTVTGYWRIEASVVPDDGDIGGGGGFGGVPASSDSIKKLELVKCGGMSGGDEYKGCTICFEDFEVGEEVSKMPCGHLFHRCCISRWLERSRLCPLCRLALPADA